jgi:uroporphyrinogen-III synthase
MELRSVLSTKTLDDKALVLAHSLGLSLTFVDFIQIKGLPVDLTSPDWQSFDSVAFTSSNAVKYFFSNPDTRIFLKGKSIFSLSEKTSSELLSHHIRADYIKKNASDLALAMISKNAKSVLHFCGNRRLNIIREIVIPAGINYSELVVYETELKSMPLDKEFDAILFYSPSGVQGFFAANQQNHRTVYCCIGETTNTELKKHSWGTTIIIPDAPTPEAMVKLVGEYFRNKPVA